MANHYLLPLNVSGVTASVNGNDMDNQGRIAGHFIINITTLTGTAPTATFTVQGKDDFTGTYYTLIASTALSTTGQTVLRVLPTGIVTANAVANDMVPKTWRVIVTTGGTVTNLTATVGANLIGG